jgi:hypothetical protein
MHPVIAPLAVPRGEDEMNRWSTSMKRSALAAAFLGVGACTESPDGPVGPGDGDADGDADAEYASDEASLDPDTEAHQDADGDAGDPDAEPDAIGRRDIKPGDGRILEMGSEL